MLNFVQDQIVDPDAVIGGRRGFRVQRSEVRASWVQCSGVQCSEFRGDDLPMLSTDALTPASVSQVISPDYFAYGYI